MKEIFHRTSSPMGLTMLEEALDLRFARLLRDVTPDSYPRSGRRFDTIGPLIGDRAVAWELVLLRCYVIAICPCP